MNRIPAVEKIAAAFHQKAVGYDQQVLVQKRVVSELVSSIKSHVNYVPECILDVGTGTGAMLEQLHSLYPSADLYGVDIALNMCHIAKQKMGERCHIVNCDVESLPFDAMSFDLVVSTSALQWVGNISKALHELRRVVRPGGNISLAFFCEGTLSELHQCFREADGRYRTENSDRMSRLHYFRGLDGIKSILESLDFEKYVVTVETEVDWYDDVYSLLKSIKNIGAGTVAGVSMGGLGWRGFLKNVSDIYQERYGNNGKIPVTYKVLYLSARI